MSGARQRGRPPHAPIYIDPASGVAWWVCSRCGEKKPETAFPKDKRRPSGRGSTCKRCNYEYVKAWRRRNPDWRKRAPQQATR